jgi:hypothetical protein
MTGRFRILAGGAVWLVALIVVHPSPFDVEWAKALLVLAALVLVPLGLDLVPLNGQAGWPGRAWQVVNAVQPPAALLLGAAYLLPPGLVAASLAMPWLVTTGLIALLGLWRVSRRGLRSLGELCMDAGWIYLVVGGAWTVSDRLGFRPLEFSPVIVLLTAIHFHYAGFALPLITGLAVQRVEGWLSRLAGVGVIAGVPAVAVGITALQMQWGSLFECLAAWLLAAAGILTSWLHLRLALDPAWPRVVRSLWIVSALSLAGSMVLAAMYGSRFFMPTSWLDIPWMRALHGTANAFGFALAGLLAWTLAKGYSSREFV